MRRIAVLAVVLALIGCALALYFASGNKNTAVPDDAKTAGKTVADFPETSSHTFDAMDGGLPLTENERRG